MTLKDFCKRLSFFIILLGLLAAVHAGKTGISNSNPGTKTSHLTKQLQKSDGYGMLFLRRAAPERPTVHCFQDPLKILIEKTGPLELTKRSAVYRVMSREPDGHPTFDTFIIALPHKPWVYTGRDRLPMHCRQGKVLVQEILQQMVRFSCHDF
jgi:hypothetical protein